MRETKRHQGEDSYKELNSQVKGQRRGREHINTHCCPFLRSKNESKAYCLAITNNNNVKMTIKLYVNLIVIFL